MSKLSGFDIKDPADVGRIAEMDEGFKCIDCNVEERTKSRLQIEELCRWWLTEVAADCNLETSIHAGPTEKYPNSNGSITFFATFPPDLGKLPMMQVMVQHETIKSGQHYQLQLPHGTLIRRSDADSAESIGSIAVDCRAQTVRYSVEEKSEKLKMIRMRSYGLEKIRSEIQTAVRSMLRRINALPSTAS